MGARQSNQNYSGFALGLFVAGALMLPGVQANSQSKPTVKSGVISGLVFLITKAGDIKPARMARVWLFYDSDPSVTIAEIDKKSAAHEWRVELGKALDADTEEGHKVQKALEEAERELKSSDKHERREGAKDFEIARANLKSLVESRCSKQLLIYNFALTETLKWVKADIQEKGWQNISEQADENGHFSVIVPKPGKYVLVVTGRAGLNDAIRESGVVTINPGEETTVKMASPEVACVDSGG